MTKVRIRLLCNDGALPSKEELLRVLVDHNVRITSVRITNNQFFDVFCTDDDNSDKIFSRDCVRGLNDINCEAVLPPNIKAKRTVILRNLDPLIYQNDIEQIKLEIQCENSQFVVDDLFKFPNSRMLKITFSTQQMAAMCVEKGLLLFKLSVPPRYVSLDRFINVDICYRCYKLDSHLSAACTRDRNYLICSICAVEGHTFKTCRSLAKCCINCGGDHNTLSMACGERKKIVEAKRRNSNVSFAAKTSQTTRLNVDNESADGVLDSLSLRGSSPDLGKVVHLSTVSVIIAAMKEQEEKGCFENVLNTLLQNNGLPKFNMGSISPPLPPPVSTESQRVQVAGIAADAVVTETASDLSVSNVKSIIYVKKGSHSVTCNNIDILVRDKKALVESNLMLDDLVNLMKVDMSVVKIVELPAAKFNSKLANCVVPSRDLNLTLRSTSHRK